MICSNNTYSQQSLDNYGSIGNLKNSNFRMNSIESNISNFSQSKDWEFSISIDSKLRSSNNVNINIFSLGKKINNNYLYIRYSPGIMQEFIFDKSKKFSISDSVQNYKTNLSFTEKYGFGYSYNFNDQFTLGVSFRYFQQQFSEEYPAFYPGTEEKIIQIREELVNKNYWRGDFGLTYTANNNLSFSLSSANLFILKDFDKEESSSEFEIKTTNFNLKEEKMVLFGFKYNPHENIVINGKYESSNSFLLGTNYSTVLNGSNISFGSTFFHDQNQEPFIAGILPSINYSNYLFSVTVAYQKYFSNRSTAKTLNSFRKYGIYNIQNNFFNSDKINLTFNFALSFNNTQQVKFVDLKINEEIFPTFTENYIDQPIATGKVVNLTDEVISLKPSSFIEEINIEKVFSPIISIQPFDTIDVPFFTIINDNLIDVKNTKIVHANFYLSTINEEPEDQIQKPILLNDKNNWDGKVRNLRFFVSEDFDFSNKYSVKILSNHKDSLANINSILKPFKKTEILFNEFVKNMSYVSDRRATVDYVQFPAETIELKGGDCDDLSTAFSSVLECVGIQTAFIDYKPMGSIGHVTLLINTELTPNETSLITINDRKYFVRKSSAGKEEVWIPIELTVLTNFNESWNIGAERFYTDAIDAFGLSKNRVEIIDIY